MNLAKVKIRSATKEDILQIQELLKATGLYFDPVDGNHKNYEEQIDDDPESIVVAEYECHLIGMVIVIYRPLFSNIAHLAVLPEHQRNGLGATLFTEALNRIKKRGGHYASGYISEHNKASLALCDALGLEEYEIKLVARYKSFS